MQYAIPRWQRIVVVAAQSLGAIAMIALMLQVSLNGLFRKLLGMQIPMTLEVTQWWYMPVLGCCGIALAAVWNEHFYVDLVHERLSQTGQRILSVFAHALTLLLTLAVTWFSLVHALDELAVLRYEPVTRLPIWPLTFLIPLAFAVYSAVLVLSLWRTVLRPAALLPERPDHERTPSNGEADPVNDQAA